MDDRCIMMYLDHNHHNLECLYTFYIPPSDISDQGHELDPDGSDRALSHWQYLFTLPLYIRIGCRDQWTPLHKLILGPTQGDWGQCSIQSPLLIHLIQTAHLSHRGKKEVWVLHGFLGTQNFGSFCLALILELLCQICKRFDSSLLLKAMPKAELQRHHCFNLSFPGRGYFMLFLHFLSSSRVKQFESRYPWRLLDSRPRRLVVDPSNPGVTG